MATLFAEDFTVGRVFELGSRGVTAEEIKEFATQWDPLPFHVDEQAAAEGPFGELIASGAHVVSICVRLASDGVLKDAAVIAGGGIREARFRRPVRPGMVLTGTTTIDELEMVDDGRGRIVLRNELRDEDGELIMFLTGDALIRRRNGS